MGQLEITTGTASRRRSGRRRGRALLAACAGLVVGTVLPGPQVGAATGPRTTGQGHLSRGRMAALAGQTVPPPGLAGARVLGAAPGREQLTTELFFRPAQASGLAQAALAVSTPGTAGYHHYLSVAGFRARFGAPATAVAAVDSYLERHGLHVAPLAPNGLGQQVTGRVSAMARAFGAPWALARTSSGLIVTGLVRPPRLPARLAGAVAYLDGTAPWAVPHDNLVRLPRPRPPARASAPTAPGRRPVPAGPGGRRAQPADQAPGAPGCTGMPAAGMTPSQLEQAYRLSGFYQRFDQGQGATIGLVEYALADTAAVAHYQACAGSEVQVTYDPSPSPPSQVDAEVAADIEVIAAMAPRARVVVYQSDQSGTGLAPWQMAVSGSAPGGLAQVLSSSWGSCEAQTGMGPAYYQAEEELFDEAALQGQTVVVATGDDGSEGCHSQDGSTALGVDDPASAPLVTAVGGTSSSTLGGPQVVWNSRDAKPSDCLGTGCSVGGASGGGQSRVWPRPSYQTALGASAPGAATTCTLGGAGCREVPDVSALAGNPYAQYCSAAACGTGAGWVSFGGTSLAAPAWAAVVALSEPLCRTPVGFLDGLLYDDPSQLVGPVTSGDNDLAGAQGGLYQASPSGGYSMAAGLGYLGGTDLSGGALCGPANLAGAQVANPTTTTLPGPYQPVVPAGPRACSPPRRVHLGAPAVGLVATQDGTGCAGYWLVGANGAVLSFGAAIGYGSLSARAAARSPVVALAPTNDFGGYWLLQADGRVDAFGDAHLHGEPGPGQLGAPAVGLAATPSGDGYWVATRAGRVLALGDAHYYGSLSGRHLSAPVVGIASTASGRGYWLVSADGGVFAFGDATFAGSAAGGAPRPVVGMAPGPYGYRLADRSGDVYAYGAGYLGGLSAGAGLSITGIAPSVDGRGYYLLGATGSVYAFGDAPYLGGAR